MIGMKEKIQSNISRSSALLASLAMLAIVGQIVLLTSALLLPLVSEYGLVGDTISQLALGRFGWVQSVTFAIAGTGTLALAYAIRQLTVGTLGSRIGSLLVGVYGLGAFLVAFFPTDPVDSPGDPGSFTTTGMIDLIVSLVSFVAMVIAMFIFTRTFPRDPRWRSLSRWIVLFPAAALSLLIVQSQGSWVGVVQRLLVAVIAGWIIVVATRVRLKTTSAEAGPSRHDFSPIGNRAN
jgi:hypothetical protein